jgi:hypothetical protein
LVCTIGRDVPEPVRSGIVGIYDYGKRVSIGVIVELSQNGRKDADKRGPSAGASERWSNMIGLNSKDAVN